MVLLATYLGGTVLATVIVTTVVCRWRSALKKKISFGTVLGSSLIANAVVLAFFGTFMVGWDFLTPDFWRGNWALGAVLPVVMIAAVMCILPALGIVVFYRKRSKKEG